MALKPDLKILVVDDMPTMRKILISTLTKIGYTNITEADDGSSAWPIIEQALGTDAPYEFIISDWNMPEMSGIELLEKVRNHEELKPLPFLMVTAETEQSNVVNAVKAGVSNYVIKPFTEDSLKEKITKIFEK